MGLLDIWRSDLPLAHDGFIALLCFDTRVLAGRAAGGEARSAAGAERQTQQGLHPYIPIVLSCSPLSRACREPALLPLLAAACPCIAF
jgi:hypothetical protein